jgi:hypothetical protein
MKAVPGVMQFESNLASVGNCIPLDNACKNTLQYVPMKIIKMNLKKICTVFKKMLNFYVHHM